MTEKKLEETCLERSSVFSGVLLHVYRDKVKLPDGGTSVREWIDHLGAAAVVPLFENGDTVLIRQYRYPPQREFIEVPAGKLDTEGEDPMEVARREMEEETGYSVGKLTPLGSFYPCIGYSNEMIHVFLGEDLAPGRQQTAHEEFVEPFTLPFTRAVEMVHTGEIQDMKTMVALLLARDFVERR